MQRLLCLIFSLTCINSVYAMDTTKKELKKTMTPKEKHDAAMEFFLTHFSKPNPCLHQDFLAILQKHKTQS